MSLTVENGSFFYLKESPILNNINFSADRGDIVAVLGKNGAGKTTLLKCITGLLKWKSGKSLLDDEDISKMPQRQRWSKIAYVPQAKNSLSTFTVEETVLLGRSSSLGIFSQPSKKDSDAVKNILNRLGISKISSKKCSRISGGELQMVLIAKALASEPDVLILDEPESNLDFRNQLIVLDTISKLASDGITCIFNTHYPAHALQRANKSLVFLSDGKTIFGETSKVVTEDVLENAFGVKTVIGNIETPSSVMKEVIPVSVSDMKPDGIKINEQQGFSLAVLAVICADNSSDVSINKLLHGCSHFLVGRMGMPYRDGGVYIINVIIDAPTDVIESLAFNLSILPGVSVKATYAKNIIERNDPNE